MMDTDLINATIARDQHVVLVVDDDPSTRYATARVLRSAGFQTKEAATGAEALARAPQVSAVVLDVHLPDIDGFEVCRRIRADDRTRQMPVMHLSAAYINNEDKVTGLNAGADAYLVRPIEPPVLVATLQALIRARMAEDQLRRSEARFRAIYNHAHSGIALLDGEGRFQDVNPAMAEMLGQPAGALVGRAVSQLAPAEWTELVAARTSAAGGEAPWQGEFPLCRPDGTLVHLEWSLSSRLEPGVRIGIALDASERRELAQRRQDLLEREQAARVTAEHHSRTKDDFIAVLSHELRTPLNAIVGWVHILNRRGGSPELLKGLDAIDRNVKTQVRIISDILDVSRISSGKLRLQRELTDPAELVMSSIGSLRGAIDEKALQIEQDLDGATQPAWIDPARFQQIFWNLMTNAIKFSNRGGRIHVKLSCDGAQLALRVRDEGAGIRPEFIGRLFDRFSQSTSPGSRTQGGLGLGMSIVKHLVELHGGSVQANSAGAGHGTTISLQMPVHQQADEIYFEGSAAGPLEGDPSAPSPSLQGLDVLVVEDNADAGEMLSVVLGDRGARVRLAVDYTSAVEAVRSAWPDIVISDIGLPGRDGYELVRQLRLMAAPGAGRLPAIALTAFARTEDRAKAMEAGFDEHLGKPLNPHTLLTAIAQLLQSQRG